MTYTFTADWFGSHDSALEIMKYSNINEKEEFHILEIGCFEGKSTIWFIENLLLNEKSTITCVDPWLDYSQKEDSLESYDKENVEWKFGTKKIKNTFLHNIEQTGKSNKVIVKQGLSNVILPQLICENKKYDMIYVDGNHVAPYVLMDAVMSWQLLKKNGIMIFDDYLWNMHFKPTLRPKISIDYFIEIFDGYCQVIIDGYRKGIRKL